MTGSGPERAAPRPGERPSGRVTGRRAPAGQVRRISFVLLLLGLLAGGLVCLLVVNTTLNANSIEIGNLQQANTADSARVQQLEQQIATESSAAWIAREAKLLGMRPESTLTFINLRTESIQAPGRGTNLAGRTARPVPGRPAAGQSTAARSSARGAGK